MSAPSWTADAQVRKALSKSKPAVDTNAPATDFRFSVRENSPAHEFLQAINNPAAAKAFQYLLDKYAKEEEAAKNWSSQFRSVGEMEEGEIDQIIEGVLQSGICFLGASPGSGKTLVALALVKAICTGEPLFGIAEFAVKTPRLVIYLIPESGDRAFRKRCEAFQIPSDRAKFLTRTYNAGPCLALSDPALLEAVRQTKAVVFLDTAARFMRGSDENSSTQNKLLVDDVVALLEAGAAAVVLIHHATKASERESMTLQNMLRGSSDIGAMCDQAYGIKKDDRLYASGTGPLEIEIANIKDREQLGGLTKLRLAASYVRPNVAGSVSYINQDGNFRVVDRAASQQRSDDQLIELVKREPTIDAVEIVRDLELIDKFGKPLSGKTVIRKLNKLGWHRVKGGSDGASPWHNDEGNPCPYEAENKAKAETKQAKKAKKEVQAEQRTLAGVM